MIGNSTTQNSINLNTASTSTTGQEFTGILMATGLLAPSTISGNLIANINNAYAGTASAGQIRGIVVTAAYGTISQNIIRNLTNASGVIGTGSSASIGGIIVTSTTAGHTITQNTIHSLSNTHASAAVNIVGIHYGGASSGTNLIERNFIHSFNLATSSTSASLTGINIAVGTSTVQNNMIRLGIKPDGTSITTAVSIIGIAQSASSNNNYYHNTIYIGGVGVEPTTTNTFGFRRTSTGVDDFRNNIVVNNRFNATTGGKHYAIGLNANTTFTSNYNVYYSNGTGGVLGLVGSIDYTTLSSWQTATNFDLNSGYGNPNFVNPTGDAASVDLHVQSPTPVEGKGVSIAGITTDFDGETRSSLTPVDIGADAGNFTLSDIYPPNISFTPVQNTSSINNRTIANLTITEDTGVPTTGSNVPRIWYRKGGTTPSNWVSNGGTLSSGTGTNGVWTFTIDYSLLNVTPQAGDIYQYYIVAQDEATTPNIITNPFGGVHTDVNTQTSAPTTPNSYNILNSFSGNYNVGTGETYTTLTGNNGIFKALNDNVLTGNVTIVITSNLTEDGTNGLNQLVSEGGNFTVTIQPADATEKVISGAVANGLIRFNGADNVTIDGRYNGSGKYLRFRNTNTSNPTITFINDASGNLIRDCYIEGATTSTTNGVVFFSTGTTTVNDNNTIQNCVIRDRSDATGLPANLIYSSGSSASITNTGNNILNNDLFNFSSSGINITSTGNENWTISGNNIYQTAARTTALTGISFASLGTNVISQNNIYNMNTNGVYRGIF